MEEPKTITKSLIPRPSRLPIPKSSIPLRTSTNNRIPPELDQSLAASTRPTPPNSRPVVEASKPEISTPKKYAKTSIKHDISSRPPTTPKSRKSLAERTVESISQLPPTPGSNRRKSDFFSADTSDESHSQTNSYPDSRRGFREIQSDDTSSVPPVPSISETLKPNAIAPSRLRTSTSRSNLTKSNAVTPKSSKTNLRAATVKASPKPVAKPSAKSANAPKSTSTSVKTTSSSSRPHSARKPSAKAPRANDVEKSSPDPMKSSAALRDQIRKARAAQNAPIKVSVTTHAGTINNQNNDVDISDDPFNQQPKGGALVIRRRVDNARTDGKLNISALGLRQVPEEVLKMYDYEFNKNDSGVAWGEVVDLTKFIAADNAFEAIPDECFPDIDINDVDEESAAPQFGGIEYLDFHGNILSGIPSGLKRLEALTYLNLSRNNLTNTSLSIISQIASLTELHMSDNKLSGELNPSTSSLGSLEVLDLRQNQLTNIPVSLSKLERLRNLNLSHNNITSIPIEVLKIPSLVQLLLIKNQLSGTLFSDTAVLPRLQTLDVSINSLSALTNSSLEVPMLKDLNFSFNRMNTFPNISSWTELVSLFAEDNRLSELPPGFTTLEHLRTVDFTGNNLTRVDNDIGLMPALDSIKFAANPIRERKFLTMGTREILRDLRARLGLDEYGSKVDDENNDGVD